MERHPAPRAPPRQAAAPDRGAGTFPMLGQPAAGRRRTRSSPAPPPAPRALPAASPAPQLRAVVLDEQVQTAAGHDAAARGAPQIGCDGSRRPGRGGDVAAALGTAVAGHRGRVQEGHAGRSWPAAGGDFGIAHRRAPAVTRCDHEHVWALGGSKIAKTNTQCCCCNDLEQGGACRCPWPWHSRPALPALAAQGWDCRRQASPCPHPCTARARGGSGVASRACVRHS
jgi:hypothetical protein